MRHNHEAFAARFERRGGPFEGMAGHGGGPRGHRGGGPRGERGFGGRGERGGPQVPDASGAAGWFAGRLPDGWFTGAPQVNVDRDEILVVGTLPALAGAAVEGSAEDVAAAEAGRVSRFREETREARMAVAAEAQARFGRVVSWGATCGSTTVTFTTASVPVMTRLRQNERQVLDTLVESGVARSRSDALVWAIRLVGENTGPWLADLRTALEGVQKVRAEGPMTGTSVETDDEPAA